jgi:hypothetical protein
MLDDLEDIAMINDSWLKTSIMAKRGLAKGLAGKRHELSIATQGDFHYVYGPYAKPVLTIDPGDVVVVETEDAFGGVITSEQDSPTAKLQPSRFMRWRRAAHSPPARPASFRNSAAWSERLRLRCSMRHCRSG